MPHDVPNNISENLVAGWANLSTVFMSHSLEWKLPSVHVKPKISGNPSIFSYCHVYLLVTRKSFYQQVISWAIKPMKLWSPAMSLLVWHDTYTDSAKLQCWYTGVTYLHWQWSCISLLLTGGWPILTLAHNISWRIYWFLFASFVKKKYSYYFVQKIHKFRGLFC